jgi:hypothetical protein
MGYKMKVNAAFYVGTHIKNTDMFRVPKLKNFTVYKKTEQYM